MWRNLNASPTDSSVCSGRTSSLRTSASRPRPTSGRRVSPASSVDRRLLEHPADDAGPLGHRPLVGRQPLEPGGDEGLHRRRHPDASTELGGRPGPSAVSTSSPSSTSIPRNSSMNSGLPSAAVVRRVLTSAGERGPTGQRRADRPRVRRRTETDRRSAVRRVPPPHPGSDVEQLGTSRADEAGAAHHGSRSRRARSGRAGSASAQWMSSMTTHQRSLTRRGAREARGSPRRAPPAARSRLTARWRPTPSQRRSRRPSRPRRSATTFDQASAGRRRTRGCPRPRGTISPIGQYVIPSP